MACYCPLTGYFSADVNASGKRSLQFKAQGSLSGVPVRVPCGQCIGCRLDRARNWAIRCMHEKRISECSCFVTLTYRDADLPLHGSLDVRAHQLFMKRLRKAKGDGVRFFMCGEYGARFNRPHYHYILFNVDFRDKRFYKYAKDGSKLYWSAELEKIWPFGDNVIGDVTFDSACYVARYVCDKVTGDMAQVHYEKVTEYGEVVQMVPEFCIPSRRPGIGKGWFDKFAGECYAHDSVIVDGREVKPPRYYDVHFEGIDAKRLTVLKRERRRGVDAAEQSPERRRVREEVTRRNLALNKRSEV